MIDPLFAPWIVEFVLAQPAVDDRLLRSLLATLPFPAGDPVLRKRLLLRRLRSDRTASERVLETLELLEDLDAGDGAASPALAAAYAAVAANCAVRRLREGRGFEEAVRRVWRRRVGDMVSAGAGLRSPELEKWGRALRRALKDGGTRELVMRVETEKMAVDAVAAYVDEALREIGRPKLELAAEILLSRRVGMGGGAARASTTSSPAAVADVEEAHASGGIGEGAGRVDADADAHSEEVQGLKGVEREHRSFMEDMYPFNKIPSQEVVKVKEDLITSCANLRAVVKDPLPDSIAAAAGLLGSSGRTTVEHMYSEQPRTLGRSSSGIFDHDAAGPSTKVADIAPTREPVTGIINDRANKQKSKPSLMDRNPTAHTYEWGDDSVESTSEGSRDSPRKSRLSSPSRGILSLLNPNKGVKFTRRRKKKWWTEKEEKVLREAVDKYGAGCWKFILNCYPTVFEGRTEVDLKDKWRNLNR